MSACYKVQDLKFRYWLDGPPIEALRGVSFEIAQGAMVCLTGPSGSGKTTLLNVLGLVEPVQTGKVHLQGHDVSRMPEGAKNEIRKLQLGFIFQQFHLFPVLTAEENVDYFLARGGLPGAERKKRVRSALEQVGLWNHRTKYPLSMSGGQRQRVAIARAIAKNPKVLIADEPTASLDQKTGKDILTIIEKLNKETGLTVILSSHDPMVISFARRRIKLIDGKLEE